MDILLYILIGLTAVLLALVAVLLIRQGRLARGQESDFDRLAEELHRQQTASAGELSRLRMELDDSVGRSTERMAKVLTDNQRLMQEVTAEQLSRLDRRFASFALENEQKLEQVRQTTEQRLAAMQRQNAEKLDEMRGVVDEKLQRTLEERMTQSFRLVNERLEQVYKGLGEIQTLAAGVGDLKKMLSNVKTRGILGEIQLGSILREILAPEQYDENVATRPGSRERVEFAVKLPNLDGSFTYLPIDAKFHGDAYAQLRDAYENSDPAAVEAAAAVLLSRVKQSARDIHDKYIDPPNTTEFGILFVPFEGLYAELVNRGMVEVLQRDYMINLAGPSTMAALLNSLQMGFRSVAIQQRSSEVWEVLRAVRTEFESFEKVLTLTQNRLDQASRELDKLVGVRTRQIRRRLKEVETLDTAAAREILELDEPEEPVALPVPESGLPAKDGVDSFPEE